MVRLSLNLSLNDWLEIAILITLWVEFWYDAAWNNREARMKRRQKTAKPRINYEKEMD